MEDGKKTEQKDGTIKRQDERTNEGSFLHEDLSATSSEVTMTPIEYIRSDEDEKENEKVEDSGRKSRESFSSQRSAGLSVKDLYGELNEDEIKIQREETRRTIISELEERVRLDADFDELDLEKGVGCRKDSNAYEDNIPIQNEGKEFQNIDPELVTWEGDDDPADPRNWSTKRKCFSLMIVSLYALVAPMSSSMPSPAMAKISSDFNITSSTISAMVVSIQVLAWAIGPITIAPFSEHERLGRKTVLDLCIWLSFAFNLGCSFSQNTAQLMVFRFIGGIFGCIPMSVCAGVISDMFSAKSRNAALAVYSLAPVLGPCIAPIVSGYILEHKSWRWCFYVLSIFNGFVAVFATIFFEETYAPKLLKLKAIKLRKETGNHHLHTIYEITNGETAWGKIYITVSRPIQLLLFHPMVLGLGSFLAFVYGFMYLLIVIFPRVFEKEYGFSVSTTGLMYIPMGCGFVLGILFWTKAIDIVYVRLTERNNGVPKPEFRLPCLIASSLSIPIGLLWFGWSAQAKAHWIMPGIGSAIFASGLVCIFQSVQNYLIDMNPRFATSSVAAAALFRSLFGFAFPLFAGKMYDKLHYGWGNTLCAVIAIILGIPFPVFCYLYGERLRAYANRRFEIQQAKRDQKNLERLKKQQSAAL